MFLFFLPVLSFRYLLVTFNCCPRNDGRGSCLCGGKWQLIRRNETKQKTSKFILRLAVVSLMRFSNCSVVGGRHRTTADKKSKQFLRHVCRNAAGESD